MGGPTDLGVAWGVAGFTSAAGLTEAFHRADEAMYRNKRERKNGRQPVTAKQG